MGVLWYRIRHSIGPSVRQRRQLRRRYGGLRWRKLKGIASKTRKRVAIYIENEARDDLEVGKVYRALPDRLSVSGLAR